MSPHNLNYDSSSSDETGVKMCKECGVLLPSCSFSSHSSTADRLRPKCRDCRSTERRDYMLKRSQGPDAPDDPPAKRQQFEPTVRGEHLYIMAFSTDPEGLLNGFKVGRSGNIAKRAMKLAVSMPHHMLVLVSFLGQGHLEDHVHSMLSPKRNTTGRGRGWFFSTLPDILHAVARSLIHI